MQTLESGSDEWEKLGDTMFNPKGLKERERSLFKVSKIVSDFPFLIRPRRAAAALHSGTLGGS